MINFFTTIKSSQCCITIHIFHSGFAARFPSHIRQPFQHSVYFLYLVLFLNSLYFYFRKRSKHIAINRKKPHCYFLISFVHFTFSFTSICSSSSKIIHMFFITPTRFASFCFILANTRTSLICIIDFVVATHSNI